MSGPAQKLVFDSSVEGLFRIGLAAELTPALKAELLGLGLDLDRRLLPAYPAEQWAQWVRACARAIFPTLPEEEGHFRLGQRATHGFAETLVGKALLPLRHLFGTRRMILRIGKSMASGCNYMQVTPKELGPTDVELTFSDVSGVPHFFRGLLNSGIGVRDGKDFDCTVVRQDGPAATYRVTWTAA